MWIYYHVNVRYHLLFGRIFPNAETLSESQAFQFLIDFNRKVVWVTLLFNQFQTLKSIYFDFFFLHFIGIFILVHETLEGFISGVFVRY